MLHYPERVLCRGDNFDQLFTVTTDLLTLMTYFHVNLRASNVLLYDNKHYFDFRQVKFYVALYVAFC